MHKTGVSELLYGVIQKLMNHELFDKFLLGGGTNLAIKYNHRVSTDIDLFSTEIVGTNHLSEICHFLENEFGKENTIINKKNFGSEQLSHLEIFLKKEVIKIDIIQNLKLLHEPCVIDGIRLISDHDIGTLKLLAAADRGNQKDFYDLYLLTEKNSLGFYYGMLRKRQDTFNKIEDRTIFDIQNGRPLEDLKKDATCLGDFSKAGDRSNSGNRVILTEESTIKFDWPVLRDKWLKKVQEFAQEEGLQFRRTDSKRKPKSFFGKFRFSRG